MKKLSILLTFALGLSFQAGAETPRKNGYKVLKRMSNGNLHIGNSFLAENKDRDQFSLPNCQARNSKNKRVRGLRLAAPKKKPNGKKNLDSAIKAVTLEFSNGGSRTFRYSGHKGKKLIVRDTGDGLNVATFSSPRCITKVIIVGEQWERGRSRANAFVKVVGVRPAAKPR